MKPIDCSLKIGGYISGVSNRRTIVRHGEKRKTRSKPEKRCSLYAMLKKMAVVVKCVSLLENINKS